MVKISGIIITCLAWATLETLARSKNPTPKKDPLLEMERIVKEHIADRKIPGGAYALIHHDRIVAKPFGKKNTGSPQLVGAQTSFQIGSISKAITAALIIRLQKLGKIKVDKPIAPYFPQYCGKKTCEGMRISHLMTHTTGVSNWGLNQLIEAQAPYDSVIRQALKAKRLGPPGKIFSYNNVTFDLLRATIEREMGVAYEKVVEEYLLAPLGMGNTKIGYAAMTKAGDYFTPHLWRKNNWQETSHSKAYYHFPAAGGFNSNIEDMVKFALLELGKKPDVLNDADLAILHQARVPAPDAKAWFKDNPHYDIKSSDYGFGHRLMTFGKTKVILHPGWIKGIKCMVAVAADRSWGFVFLQNTDSDVAFAIVSDLSSVTL